MPLQSSVYASDTVVHEPAEAHHTQSRSAEQDAQFPCRVQSGFVGQLAAPKIQSRHGRPSARPSTSPCTHSCDEGQKPQSISAAQPEHLDAALLVAMQERRPNRMSLSFRRFPLPR